jgi:hypothetical protein
MTLHIDIPTRAGVERLLTARDAVCVSIYLATSPVTEQAQAARIELKNLVADAVEQLEESGADRRAVSEVRESLDDLVDDGDFWAEQARSLAVFASPRSLQTFRLPNRLTSGVEVADRFYVKPLLRAVTFPQAAFVLALAAGSVRLIEALRESPPFPVTVPGLPTDAASAAGKASIADRSPAGRIQGSEGQKVRLRQYRSLNSYPHLVEPGIRGSPQGVPNDELAAEARTVLDEVYAGELGGIRDRFELRSSQGRASTDVATVARAATYGSVDTLLVDIDEKVPGQVDEQSGAVTFSEDDAATYGVVDEIARRVLLSGGRVLAVRGDDVPGGGSVAAILRYSV